MSTSTVLRVKRRLEDNPQDALVLLCKRIKTNEEEISPSLFVFRGTVDSQESTHLKNIVPQKDKALAPSHNVNDIIDKMRKERKETSIESRYELVNYSRGLDGTKEITTDDYINLVDLQQKISDDEIDNVKYAYDLYIAAKQDFDITMLDNLVSIENYETDLIFGSYRDNGRKTPSSDGANDDDDDSNDENNWRNEYPDSEPSSIDEDDIVNAIKNCNLEDELSSDNGEDKIYEEPADLFNEDVKRYGEAYSKYKARILKENPDLSNQSLIHCHRVKDLDEEALDGYKDDSDDGFYYGEEQDTAQFREQYASDEDDDAENSDYSPD